MSRCLIVGLFTLYLVSVMLSSCTEKVTAVNSDVWERYEFASFEQNYIVNTCVKDDVIYGAFSDGIWSLDWLTDENYYHYNSVYTHVQNKPAISPRMVACYDEGLNSLVFYPFDYNHSILSTTPVPPSYIDSGFIDGCYDLGWDESPIGVFMGNRFFAFVAARYQRAYLVYIDIEVSGNAVQPFDSGYWDISSYDSDEYADLIYTYNLGIIGDDVIASYGFHGATLDKHMIIHPDLSTETYDRPHGEAGVEFFEYKGRFWMFDLYRNLQYSDNYTDWQKYGKLGFFGHGFIQVDDALFCYVNDRLIFFRLEEDYYSIYEPDTSQFAGCQITSINELDGNVVITTVGGMFYAPKQKILATPANPETRSSELFITK